MGVAGLRARVMSWPTPPAQSEAAKAAELQKSLFEGQVQDEVARVAWERSEATRRDADTLARSQAAWQAEYALEKMFQEARIDVAKKGIERANAGAEFVRNAAAAIGTIYMGVVGATYGAAEKSLHAPARAIIPAIFLGLALVFAAVYVAYLSRASPTPAPEADSRLRVYQERRITAFTDWVAAYTLNRAYWLHTAVFSLAFGVAALAAPFVSWSGWTVYAAPIVCLAVALLAPLLTRQASSWRRVAPESRNARDQVDGAT
jgi:hypothetical protein